nr:MAG TPA: hypothetical protein [Herelleviridae sp.]
MEGELNRCTNCLLFTILKILMMFLEFLLDVNSNE